MFSDWRRVAFVSCMHIGSSVALWPDEWVTDEGAVIQASGAQRTIRQQWDHFWSKEAKDADTVILLGDCVQGKNVKDFGLGTVTPSLDEQVMACLSLLKPKVRDKQILGVSGSKYHDSVDVALDRRVIELVGGQYLGSLRKITLSGPDRVLCVAHGSNNPSMYKGSFEDRESMLLDANEMTRDIEINVRGHWHYFNYLENSSRTLLRVPGWQCHYPAKFMIDLLGKKNNQLGAVVMDIGPDKMIKHEQLYDPPLTWSAPLEV